MISELKEIYPELLKDRYKLIDEDLQGESYEILGMIARKRGMLLPGGVENIERASIMLCDEFRGSKMGRISLERPSENE